MKQFIFMIAVCSCFISKASTIEKSHAQILSADAVYFTTGGQMWGFTDDATMATAANNYACSGSSIKSYVDGKFGAANHFPSRSLSTGTYTISSNAAIAYYTISISCTATIGGSSAADVTMSYSTNGGSTWVVVGSVGNSNTVTLAIVLNSITVQKATIVAPIPAGALCKMASTSSGTATITSIQQIETY